MPRALGKVWGSGGGLGCSTRARCPCSFQASFILQLFQCTAATNMSPLPSTPEWIQLAHTLLLQAPRKCLGPLLGKIWTHRHLRATYCTRKYPSLASQPPPPHCSCSHVTESGRGRERERWRERAREGGMERKKRGRDVTRSFARPFTCPAS